MMDTWAEYYDESTRTYRVPCEILFNDGLAPEKAVSDDGADSNDANAPESARERSESAREQPDSREKLEADVRNVIAQWYDEARWTGAADSLHERVVMKWLDRQADITRAEWCSEQGWWDSAEECNRATAKVHDMQAEVDELTAEREEYRALCGKMLGVAQELRVVLEAWEGMR